MDCRDAMHGVSTLKTSSKGMKNSNLEETANMKTNHGKKNRLKNFETAFFIAF